MPEPKRPNSLIVNEALLKDFVDGRLEPAVESKVAKFVEARPELMNRIISKSGDGFLQRLRQVNIRAASQAEPHAPKDVVADILVSPQQPAQDKPISNGLSHYPGYQVIKELGRGGMGVVYLAKNIQMDRLEVLKVLNERLLDHAGAKERFLREVRAVSKLNHVSIVTSYSVVQQDQLVIFAMEYVRGMDLQKYTQKYKPLPIGLTCSFARQIADGLQHAQEKGLVHRDIKPSNVMVYKSDDRLQIKILDFGLAKANSEESAKVVGLTQDGTMLGTPEYMSPEQTLNAAKADIRADIYSLGCTLYFMLTGGPPFTGTHGAVLMAHAQQQPMSLKLIRPEIPVELEAIVAKMMAKDVHKRYQSPAELVQALTQYNTQAIAMRYPKATHETEGESKTTYVLDQRDVETSVEVETEESPATAPALDITSAAGVTAPPAPMRRSTYSRSDQTRATIPRWLYRVGFVLGSLLFLGAVWQVSTILLRPVNVPSSTRPTILGDVTKHDDAAADTEPTSSPTDAGETSVADQVDTVDIKENTQSVGAPRPPKFPFNETVAKKYQSKYAAFVKGTVSETNSVGMTMVLIPPGQFEMGFSELPKSLVAAFPYTNVGWFNNAPKHRVNITRGFRMSATEVTVKQFKQFVSETGYDTDTSKDLKGRWGFDAFDGRFKADPKFNWENPGYIQSEDFPVTNVSWHDATHFCEWLGGKEKKEYRLPTEAEWEYACRAGTATRFCFGDEIESMIEYGNIADESLGSRYSHRENCLRSSDGHVHTGPVGMFKGNAFGLYDMHGNVFEWCLDGYRQYPRSEETDPRGPVVTSGERPNFRGGSWYYAAAFCMSARRGRIESTDRDSNVGFRIICPLSP